MPKERTNQPSISTIDYGVAVTSSLSVLLVDQLQALVSACIRKHLNKEGTAVRFIYIVLCTERAGTSKHTNTSTGTDIVIILYLI